MGVHFESLFFDRSTTGRIAEQHTIFEADAALDAADSNSDGCSLRLKQLPLIGRILAMQICHSIMQKLKMRRAGASQDALPHENSIDKVLDAYTASWRHVMKFLAK